MRVDEDTERLSNEGVTWVLGVEENARVVGSFRTQAGSLDTPALLASEQEACWCQVGKFVVLVSGCCWSYFPFSFEVEGDWLSAKGEGAERKLED